MQGPEKISIPSKFIFGSVAGLVATAPMTVIMEGMFRHLPSQEKYPLPPRILTIRIWRRLIGELPKSEDQRLAATLIAHFGFGTLMGSVCGLVIPEKNKHPFVSGGICGLLVWFVNYQLLIPSARLMPAASKQPVQRNNLLVVSHLVWGLSWMGVFCLLTRRRNNG